MREGSTSGRAYIYLMRYMYMIDRMSAYLLLELIRDLSHACLVVPDGLLMPLPPRQRLLQQVAAWGLRTRDTVMAGLENDCMESTHRPPFVGTIKG